ncbi:ABC transporter, substrate-binding protein (cluster 12, methionine/phosphonates) [hydrothermal vent metagenome]|uniref:ABC transporter, substrate-binding protein (Cluster 12, methionine/phosphonates) n=1 Tax=hydrothermal vent metagenome TaxID=652676 RepID=A0A3B0XEZ8_9ZZZZ
MSLKLKIILLFFFALPFSQAGHLPNDNVLLRFGITPVVLDERAQFLKEWKVYLERELNRPVEFVQRGNYREITDLLLYGKIDFAWICGFPYVANSENLNLVAVPNYQGQPRYRSYIIVRSDNENIHELKDFKGLVFAYSDPDSNSGYLYPRYELLQQGINPDHFFRKTFFAGSHHHVIESVVTGLSAGGAVDGYIWDTLKIQYPEMIAKTKIISTSPEFGFPPIVARKNLPIEQQNALRAALIKMQTDPVGKKLIKQLNIDGFMQASESLYKSIDVMAASSALKYHDIETKLPQSNNR